MSVRFISRSIVLILTVCLMTTQAGIVLAGRRQGHLQSGTTHTGGVSAGSSSTNNSQGRSGSASGFTCLKVGNERGGIYSLRSNTGMTMLSPLEYDACLSATRDLNQGKFTCIRVSRGADPQYALASVERIIRSPLRYDACRQAVNEFNR